MSHLEDGAVMGYSSGQKLDLVFPRPGGFAVPLGSDGRPGLKLMGAGTVKSATGILLIYAERASWTRTPPAGSLLVRDRIDVHMNTETGIFSNGSAVICNGTRRVLSENVLTKKPV